MKSLQKIILSALFIFISIGANANGKTEKLVNKMVNDPNVTQLLKNKIALSFIKNIKTEDIQTSNYIFAKINEVTKENIILKDYVNNQFPEFKNLTISEKEQVIEGILYTPALTTFWDCVETRTATFVVAVLGFGAPAAAAVIFKKCIYTALIIDVAGDAGTDALATPVEGPAAVAEVNGCKLLAVGTAGVEAIVVKEYIGAIFKC